MGRRGYSSSSRYSVWQADGGYYRRRHRFSLKHVCNLLTPYTSLHNSRVEAYVECIYLFDDDGKKRNIYLPKCMKCPVVCKNKNKKKMINKCNKCLARFKCWTGEYSK